MGRREFLEAAATAAGAAALLSARAQPADATDANPFDRAMRWAQLAFVENDPGRYDPQFWLDYFARTHCDAVTLSAGGVVAFYPTRVPFHRPSAWMKEKMDPFGELAHACRQRGLLVLARVDPHAVYDDARAAHPEWIAVDERGQPRRHWANPDMWVTCALGPRNFENVTEIVREIATLYDVQGIFANRWAGSGMCYCETCRRNFKTASGKDLPGPSPDDPARRDHILWRRQRLRELWDVWDAAIRSVRPGARFIPNGPPGLDSAARAPFLAVDHQARRGLTPPWDFGRSAKQYRAVMGDKPVAGLFSVGVEEAYRWKDSVQSGPEIRLWALDGIANGFRPWFTKFSGVLYDRRWLATVEDLYAWHHRNERYLRNEAPLARVAVVYSEQTRDFYGKDAAEARVEDHLKGMYHALIEARVPFEMVNDTRLESADVDRFKLLVLPNVAALSDAQCRSLATYVDRGGSLLATFETSLYDEAGASRKDFGLRDVLGVSFDGQVDRRMQNSYLALDAEARRTHPLLAGLQDAPRIINSVQRVRVRARGEFPSPVTLIPSYPDLPMEHVFPRVEKTAERQVYLREQGRSRVVYFPGDLDRTFWEVLAPDHGRLLANAVQWAANETPPLTVAGPGLFDVTAWRQKDSLAVHLVNLTNAMAMKGPVREFVPVGPMTVTIRLPAGARTRGVRLLVAETQPKADATGGTVTVVVPSVRDHEVVAVDL
jgi:putative glycosyl hydrolase-like family 6 (GHL6) protein/glycosyl hydrolase family 42 (putative beta-galactosidase)